MSIPASCRECSKVCRLHSLCTTVQGVCVLALFAVWIPSQPIMLWMLSPSHRKQTDNRFKINRPLNMLDILMCCSKTLHPNEHQIIYNADFQYFKILNFFLFLDGQCKMHDGPHKEILTACTKLLSFFIHSGPHQSPPGPPTRKILQALE